MSRNSSLETGAISEVYVTAMGFEPQPPSLHLTNQPFSQTGQVFVYELSGISLSVPL